MFGSGIFKAHSGRNSTSNPSSSMQPTNEPPGDSSQFYADSGAILNTADGLLGSEIGQSSGDPLDNFPSADFTYNT